MPSFCERRNFRYPRPRRSRRTSKTTGDQPFKDGEQAIAHIKSRNNSGSGGPLRSLAFVVMILRGVNGCATHLSTVNAVGRVDESL